MAENLRDLMRSHTYNEGSLDEKDWHLIDEQEGLTELSAPGVLKTFAVKKKGRYSCFKFTQTGLNSYIQHLKIFIVSIFYLFFGL